MRRLARWYVGKSIRFKMTVLFVVMSIIPAAVLGAVSLNLFSRNLEQNGIESCHRQLEFLDYRLDQQMYEIHEAVLLSAYDTSMRRYFDPDASMTSEERDGLRHIIERALVSLRMSQAAHSVMLVGEDGGALVYSLEDFPNVRSVEKPDYQILDSDKFHIYDAWAAPTYVEGTAVIPYERMVLAESGGRVVARLVVNYPETAFAQLYQSYEGDRQTEFYILDGEGRILSCANKELFARDSEDALRVSAQQLAKPSGSFHSGGYLVTYLRNDRRGYTLVGRTPLGVFTRMFRPVMLLLLGLAVVCVAVCLALGTLLSRSIIRPLYALIDRVSTDRTSAAHASALETRNEIDILSQGYDDVVARLQDLIADYYEEQRKKREAQIRALEFQINPHFLYNTLSTIIWLIDAGEGERAIEITQELSSFFRISISKGRDFITLREEVRHVQLYIDIQKARYADRIFFEYDVPEELMEYVTPKLVLQPLVENSILYGMQTRHDRRCHIAVRARLEADVILLTVEDDGESATEETIAGMNTFLRDRDSVPQDGEYGIGISNVHDRVRMSFGEGYGLSYRRIQGKTVATLRIRAMKGGNDRVSDADRR